MEGKVVNDSTNYLSRLRFYAYYAVLHIVLAAIVLAFSSFEEAVFLYWLSLMIIVLFFFFFYMRMDFVLPWYKLHVKFSSGLSAKKKMSKLAFTFVRLFIWVVTISWIPLFIILSSTLLTLFKFYIFLWLTFFSFYNSEYLFTSYERYQAKLRSNNWRLFNHFG